MKKIYLIVLLFVPATAFSMGEVDPIVTKVMVDKLEVREAGGKNPFVWDVSMYIGKDLNKLFVKTKGEWVDSKVESSRVEVLYSRAVSPYWDVTAGIRHDIQADVDHDWLQVGFHGLAPYFIESDISFYVGESGRSALELEFEKEFMLTQKWVLSPELEMSFHGYNDEESRIGSGLSKVEFGLRLYYAIKREFAPYIGINWEKDYGTTAGMKRDDGHDTSDTQIVFGINAWF